MEALPLRWGATLVVFLEIGVGARFNRVGLGLVIGVLGFCGRLGCTFFFLYFTALGIETELLELDKFGLMGV